eukprot:GDKH01013418.1.p1 GENE.GDKH01013418.1~~GDKH01013418.1.p1  ORF type:complete len:293 (-),score=39.63 GDKH01013418.1:397-1275(-)
MAVMDDSAGDKWMRNRMPYCERILPVKMEVADCSHCSDASSCPKSLTFQQQPAKRSNGETDDWDEDASGRYIWDAAMVLGHYLGMDTVCRTLDLSGKRVIELGAGCGMPGISLACRHSNTEVWLTDLPTNLELLTTNSLANHPVAAARGSQLKVHPLVWGEEMAAALQPPFDVVIGADVVYDPHTFEDLVSTLAALGDNHTTYLLAFEERWSDVTRFFFRDLSEEFEWDEIPLAAQHPDYRHPSIRLLQLTRKSALSQQRANECPSAASTPSESASSAEDEGRMGPRRALVL